MPPVVSVEEIKAVAREYGFEERRPEASCTLFFKQEQQEQQHEPTLINVFYTTRGVMTLLHHASKRGYNQLWRSDAYDSLESLAAIFQNPRLHTGKGYRNRAHAVRGCPYCGIQKKRDGFSKNQWRKGAQESKCHVCVEQQRRRARDDVTPENHQASNQVDTSNNNNSDGDADVLVDRKYITCDATGCQVVSPVIRCQRCHMVYYCSPTCQQRHASKHQPDCIPIHDMRQYHALRREPNVTERQGMAMTYQLSGNRSFESLVTQAEYLYQKNEQWRGALELYAQLLAREQDDGLPPQWRQVWMGMSRCFYEIGDYEQSIGTAEAAIEMNRRFQQVHKYMALSQKSTGDRKAAIATMTRAVLYEAPWDDKNRQVNLDALKDLKKIAPDIRMDPELTSRSQSVDSILLYGVDEGLWRICFDQGGNWPCETISLPDECTREELERVLQRPGLGCVVICDCNGPHMERLLQYYRQEQGLVVFFGIEGVFSLPREISARFGVDWTFSSYTKHDYILAYVGHQVLGGAIREQQYSKSNHLAVPPQDRILVPKPWYSSPEDYREQEGDPDDADDFWAQQYDDHLAEMGRQVPLALHRAEHGGAVAYLGFVNGDGNIPKFVQAICTRSKTVTQ